MLCKPLESAKFKSVSGTDHDGVLMTVVSSRAGCNIYNLTIISRPVEILRNSLKALCFYFFYLFLSGALHSCYILLCFATQYFFIQVTKTPT